MLGSLPILAGLALGGAFVVGRRTALGAHRPGPGKVRPTFGDMSLDEVEIFMREGLVGVDKLQITQGDGPARGLTLDQFNADLASGRIRYQIRDPRDHHRNANEVYAAGGGDCEDLAYLETALRQLEGLPGYVEVIPTGPDSGHVVVGGVGGDLGYSDPSERGGMGQSAVQWDRRPMLGAWGARARAPRLRPYRYTGHGVHGPKE